MIRRLLSLIVVLLALVTVWHMIRWVWMTPDEKNALVTRLVFPPQHGDILWSPPSEAVTRREVRMMEEVSREFWRCGGSVGSSHQADGELLFAENVSEFFKSAINQRIWMDAQLNSGPVLRAAEICRWIGKCDAGLPSFANVPKGKLSFQDERTFMTPDQLQYERLKALSLACGQGRRFAEKRDIP